MKTKNSVVLFTD